MAVTLLGVITRYTGESGDAKPTAGVAEGSQFYETDTRLSYVYDGAAWVRDSKIDVVVTGSNVTAGTGTLSATFEEDGSGDGVLRVVDAAPWGYNETLDATRTLGAAKSGTITVAAHNATASSTTALASSASRTFCKIQNVSDTNVTLNLAGGTAVALVGVVLLPFGIWEAKLGDWDFTTGAITCIHGGTGNKALAVISGVA